MELNREQVIKALECCYMQELEHNENCPECPYTDLYPNCAEYLGKDALSLIKELTEKYEDLQRQFRDLDIECCRLEKRDEELTEENERLRAKKEAENKELFYKWKKLADETADRYEGLYQDAKKALVADTVQKMKEMLLKEFLYINGQVLGCIGASVVERITKEMLEGKE